MLTSVRRFIKRNEINYIKRQYLDLVYNVSWLTLRARCCCSVIAQKTMHDGRWHTCYITLCWLSPKEPSVPRDLTHMHRSAVATCAQTCWGHAHYILHHHNAMFVSQEWKDGLASPEDLSPATLQSPSYITDSLIGCTSIPNTQVGITQCTTNI